MQTDKWGPSEWESMQNKAFGSPDIFSEEDKKNYQLFFEINVKIIPCLMCQYTFINMMKYIPITSYLDGRDSLCFWLFIMHNLVNRKLNKPLQIFSHVIYKYENIRARCGNKNKKEQYKKCKEQSSTYTFSDAEAKALKIKQLYENISYGYLENYYKSNTVIDPNYQKCDV